MKRVLFVVLVALLSVFGGSSFAQTFLIARMGIKGDGPTYHLAEVFQQRGRWIAPDIGYIDFADPGKYREIFIGGGAVLFNSKRLTVIEEVYLNAATGLGASGALYFFPWTYVGVRLSSKLSGEAVYFPYLPLNESATIQHVIERAKLEYSLGRLRLGGGYGAYQFGEGPWQNRPFVTATLKTGRFGDLELWLQRFKDGKQLQVRYFNQL